MSFIISSSTSNKISFGYLNINNLIGATGASAISTGGVWTTNKGNLFINRKTYNDNGAENIYIDEFRISNVCRDYGP